MRRIVKHLDGALFDGWKTTPEGIAAFRIGFALSAGFLAMPAFTWITEVPPALFRPPLGPLRLLPSLPPDAIVLLLKLVLVTFLVALLVGYRTPIASWGLSITWLFVSGLSFSFGKIDHIVLPAIVPAIFALSGWGAVWSIDQRRGRPTRIRTWPFTILALCVAVSMAYAAYIKISTGWLSPKSQAAYGHLTRQVIGLARSDLLALPALRLNVPALWELADWSTVLLEASLLVLWVKRSTTRAWAFVATLFHLFIFLTFNIPFLGNVIAYMAWLPWTEIATRVGGLFSFVRPKKSLALLGAGVFGLACLTSTYPVGIMALGALPLLTPTQAPIVPLGVAVTIACTLALGHFGRQRTTGRRGAPLSSTPRVGD